MTKLFQISLSDSLLVSIAAESYEIHEDLDGPGIIEIRFMSAGRIVR